MNRFPSITLAASFVLSGLATASLANGGEQGLLFVNATHATVRIEAVPPTGGKAPSPVVVEPRSQKLLSLSAGFHAFDIVAFRAQPQRIHHIGVDIAAGESSVYRFTPHATGNYLLGDGPALRDGEAGEREPIASGDGRDEPGQGEPAAMAQACREAMRRQERAVLWFDAERAQHYSERGDLLCGVDGSDYFLGASLRRHHVCDAGWTRCVRHEGGDIVVPAATYTSELPDIGRMLVKRRDAGATVLWTQRATSPFDPSLTAWLTLYSRSGASAPDRECAPGYRLHYQGFCINIEDEQRDDPLGLVRGRLPEVAPGGVKGRVDSGGPPAAGKPQ